MKIIGILAAAIFSAVLIFKWSQIDSKRHDNPAPKNKEHVSLRLLEKTERIANSGGVSIEDQNSDEPVIKFSDNPEEKLQEIKTIEEKIRDQRIVERLNSGDLTPTDQTYWGEVFKTIALEKTRLLEKEIAKTEEKSEWIYGNHPKNLERIKMKFAKARGV